MTTPHEKKRNVSFWLRLMTVLIALCGISLTAHLTLSSRNAEKMRLKAEFERTSQETFSRTLREIQLFMEVLDSIRQLHTLSIQTSEEGAYEEFVRKGMLYQRRILGAYGFAQHIPNDFRATFEQESVEIVWGEGGGPYGAVLPKSEYFPLTSQTPPHGLGIPEGYDLSIRPADLAAIQAMRKNEIFALAGPSPALAEHNVFMFAPILYNVEGSPQRYLFGFALALFSPERILKRATEGSASVIHFTLNPVETDTDQTPNQEKWIFAQEFTLAQQYWVFRAEMPAGLWKGQRAKTPEWIALSGLGITFFFVVLLALMGGQTRRIEIQVQNRTQELSILNRQLKTVMEERRELENEVLQITAGEKARIGRDLHDSLGQKLTGVLYLFGAYRRHVDTTDPEMEEQAEQIGSTIRDAVTQVRRIARGLAPVELTEDGLPDALRSLAEESSSLFGIPVEFYAEREGRPGPAGAAEHLFLIAQEAVNNAVRHGKAGRIIITLDYDEAGGILTIEDNGKGFHPRTKTDKVGGNGLRIMRHRAEVFGGDVHVGKGPTGGTTVICHFPASG